MKTLISSLLCLVLFVSSGAVSAATLDFYSLGVHRLGGNIVELPEATVKGFESAPPGLRASLNVTPDGFLCNTWFGSGCSDLDVEIEFKAPVSNLMFEGRVGYLGFGPPSMIWASVFDAAHNSLGRLEHQFFNNASFLFDFSGIGDVSYLSVWQSSPDLNPAIGNFSFNQTGLRLAEHRLSPVPVPATAWLFGTAALAFAGFACRRKIA